MEKKRPKFQQDTGWFSPDTIDLLPPAPGAYGLLIRLPSNFRGGIGALGQVSLSPGRYLYLGSAHGSGGMRGRLRRHLRDEKRLHWHVDYLTNAGTLESIFVFRGGSECDLVDQALKLPDINVPVVGFGSSDCRRCAAHLLAIPQKGTVLINAFSSLL